MSRRPGRNDEAGVITPRIGRASPLPSRSAGWARLLGATGLVALTATLFWLLTDQSFRVSAESVSIDGIRLADADQVREHIGGIERSPNVFRVRASEVVRDLQGLPGVSAATATVLLPSSVKVHVTEREPIFVWSNGVTAWLVDEGGMLFAPGTSGLDPELSGLARERPDAGEGPDADERPEGPDDAGEGPADAGEGPADAGEGPADAALAPDPSVDASRAVASGTPAAPGAPGSVDEPASGDPQDADIIGLPVVEDHRLVEVPPGPGDRLPALELAVMRQLLALTPELLSSRSEALRLSIDERDGYVLRSRDLSWQAVFGHYTPTLQPPDVVPRQVQCLRWLLADREMRVVRVRLVPSGNGCGTFTRVGQPG